MEIMVNHLCENIHIFSEVNTESPVDAYFIVGTHRAALIDTLQGVTGLYEEVRKITSLPVDVLITHGHGDHVGESFVEFAEAGCAIYMDLKDLNELRSFYPDIRVECFTDLKDGTVFDLGGYRLETVFCGGHTAGSVVFLDREHQLLFSGDSIGSGNFWIQLPESTSMASFLKNLESLRKKLKGMEQLVIHPGHRWQMPQQLNGKYIDDIYAISEGILNGTFVGIEDELDFLDRHIFYRTIGYGMVSAFCYNPNKVM